MSLCRRPGIQHSGMWFQDVLALLAFPVTYIGYCINSAVDGSAKGVQAVADSDPVF